MRAQLDFAFIYDNPSLRHPSFWPHITRSTLDDPKGLLLTTLWQAKTNVVPCISLLLFPGEGKRNHHSYSKNQLMCDLSTCLHQQESLGLTVVENVGFVASNGVVQIYGIEEDRRGDGYLRVPALPFCDLQPTAAAGIPPILIASLQALRLLGHPHLGGFPKVNGPKNHVYSEGKSGSWRADNPLSGNIRRSSGVGGGGGGGGEGGDGDNPRGQDKSGRVGQRDGGSNSRKRHSSMDPPNPPASKKQKAQSDGGTDEVDDSSPVPELDDPPYDTGPHDFSQTPESHWDEQLQLHAGDVRWKDDPPRQPSLPLSIDNLKAHTDWEGSIDVLSRTGMSMSSKP